MTATTLSPREMKRLRKQGADYVSPSPYTVRAAFRRGDLFTKLSAVVFGLGDIVRKQYVKGIAMLALEIAYFVFMAINGVDYLSKLPTLGTNAGGKKLVDGFWVYTEPDRSVVILLYGVATLVITAAFIGLCAFVMVNKNKLGFVGFQQAYLVNHANVAAAFHNRIGAEIGIEHGIFNIVQKFVVVE